MEGTRETARWASTPYTALGVIFALTLGCMAPALVPGADLAWDDASLIRHNPLMESIEGLGQMFAGSFWQTEADESNDYYRPLVSLSYWLEVRAFGGRALGHHWVNMLIHLGCVWLVFRWLARRADPRGVTPELRMLWLGFAALVFAIHPSRPESVAWIAGRTDPLSLLFGLGAFEAYRHAGRTRVAAASALFVAALLCKETAIMLVPLWLVDRWLLPGGDDHDARQRRIEPAMWAVAAIAVTAFAARFSLVPVQERPLGSVAGVLSALGLYTRELLAPFPPSAVIGTPPMDGAGQPLYPLPWVLGGAAVAIALALLFGMALRRPGLRPWAADALWFVLPLAPALQILSLTLIGHVAERFMYTAMMGASALLLRAGLAWSRRRAPSPGLVKLGIAVTVVIYAPFTFTFASALRSDEALWNYELAVDPERDSVLEHALDHVPPDDLGMTRAVAGEGVRVALREGHPQVAMRIALRWARAFAHGVPAEQCPEDVIYALDDLALGRTARFGQHEPLEVKLPEREARDMLHHHGPYWGLRADLMIRCGELDQALASLQRAPATLETAVMRGRALALRGDFDAAEQATSLARERYPFAPSLARAGEAIRTARTLMEGADGDHRSQVWKARAHMMLGDLRGARALLQDAEDSLWTDVEYHHARIDLAVLARHPDGGTAELAQARQALPEAEPLWRQLAQRGAEGSPGAGRSSRD